MKFAPKEDNFSNKTDGWNVNWDKKNVCYQFIVGHKTSASDKRTPHEWDRTLELTMNHELQKLTETKVLLIKLNGPVDIIGVIDTKVVELEIVT